MSEDIWMTYEEYVAHQKALKNAEARFFGQNGLGWLVDFLSKGDERLGIPPERDGQPITISDTTKLDLNEKKISG